MIVIAYRGSSLESRWPCMPVLQRRKHPKKKRAEAPQEPIQDKPVEDRVADDETDIPRTPWETPDAHVAADDSAEGSLADKQQDTAQVGRMETCLSGCLARCTLTFLCTRCHAGDGGRKEGRADRDQDPCESRSPELSHLHDSAH